MEINISSDVSSFVAWYAAIVSTLGLFIQFLQYWFNEKIHIGMSYLMNMTNHGGMPHLFPPDKEYLKISIMNKGKRPITIGIIGYLPIDKKDTIGILPSSLDKKEILEGKSADYLIEQSSINFEKVKCFFAEDLTGRRFTLKYKKGRIYGRN